MTTATQPLGATANSAPAPLRNAWFAYLLTGLAFAILFAQPAMLLASDWWNNPEAGAGLLLAPVAGWLLWKSRHQIEAHPNRALGIILLLGAVALRYVSGLAAELFTMRFSMVIGAIGLAAYFLGVRQVKRWWLPVSLLILSIPLPEILINALALPLQFKASAMGASLLSMRDVAVRLDGNVIQIPGHRLFVTEACSGLRSLTALVSLGVLAGGLWLRHPLSRIFLVAGSIPVAVVINGVRVFLTGFLVYFVDPALGEGFMHVTEGWLMFLVAFAILGAMAWALGWLETRMLGPETTNA